MAAGEGAQGGDGAARRGVVQARQPRRRGGGRAAQRGGDSRLRGVCLCMCVEFFGVGCWFRYALVAS